MHKLAIVGIDPGKAGGVACIYADEALIPVEYAFEKMPGTIGDFVQLILKFCENSRHIRVAIERQHAFPGQGVVSTAKIMQHYGELRGALSALMIPFRDVDAVTWKKAVGLARRKETKSEYKRRSRALAQQLFGVLLPEGVAEAALIAEWMRREERGEG